MATSFDAGTIVGTVDTNLDPFHQGLGQAADDADAFEDGTKPNVEVSADTAKYDEEMDEAEAKADALANKNPTVKVDADTSKALPSLEKLAGPAGIGGIITLAGSIAPAFAPAIAAVAGLGIAGSGAMVTVAAGAGILYGQIKSNVSNAIADAGAIQKTLQAINVDKASGNIKKLQSDLQLLHQQEQDAAKIKPWMDLDTALNTLTGDFDKLLSGGMSGQVDLGKTMAEPIANLFTTLDGVVPKLVPLFNSVDESVGPMAKTLENLVTGNGLSGFVKALSTVAGPTLEADIKVVSNILDGLFKLFPSTTPYIQDFDKLAVKLSADFDSWASSKGPADITSLFNYIKTNLPGIKTVFSDFVGLWPGLVTDLKNLGDGKSGLSAVTGLISTVKSIETGPLSVLTTLLGDLNSVLGPKATAQIAAWLIVGAKVAPMISGIGDALKLFGMSSPWMIAITALAAAAILIVKNWTPISAFFTKIGKDIASWATTAWKDVKGFFDDVTSFLKQWGPEILILFAPFIGIPLTIWQHWSAISGYLSTVWGWISGFFSKVTGAVTGEAKSIYNGGISIVDGLYNGMIAAWKTVNTFLFTTVPKDISSAFTGAATWLYNMGSSIIGGLHNGINYAWTAVKNAFLAVPNSIWSFLQNAISGGPTKWIYDIGYNIMVGLWNGIEDMANWILKHITSLVNSIIPAPIRKVLGIASPSKVLAEIGGYTMEGLDQGLTDTANRKVLPTIKKIAGSITTGLGGLKTAAGGDISVAMAGALGSGSVMDTIATQIVGLRQDVRKLPGATGEATGDQVADKLTSNSTKTAQLQLAAGRAA